MTEAARCLSLSEAGARKQLKNGNGGKAGMASRFPAGLEWEILLADAVVMLGLTHALRYVLWRTVTSLLTCGAASRIWGIFNACDYKPFLTPIPLSDGNYRYSLNKYAPHPHTSPF
jgi:hypothetical protein